MKDGGHRSTRNVKVVGEFDHEGNIRWRVSAGGYSNTYGPECMFSFATAVGENLEETVREAISKALQGEKKA